MEAPVSMVKTREKNTKRSFLREHIQQKTYLWLTVIYQRYHGISWMDIMGGLFILNLRGSFTFFTQLFFPFLALWSEQYLPPTSLKEECVGSFQSLVKVVVSKVFVCHFECELFYPQKSSSGVTGRRGKQPASSQFWTETAWVAQAWIYIYIYLSLSLTKYSITMYNYIYIHS